MSRLNCGLRSQGWRSANIEKDWSFSKPRSSRSDRPGPIRYPEDVAITSAWTERMVAEGYGSAKPVLQ